MSAAGCAVETPLDRPAAAWSFALLCLLATLVFNQSAIHWRTNIADSHLFAYFGWSILHGGVPYLDMWDNKPPGIWWMNALAFAISDDGFVPDILVGATGLSISVLALCAYCARAHHVSSLWIAAPTICVLLSHVTFECGGNRTETWLIACECVAIAAYSKWLRDQRMAALIVAALAVGCAPWFKQNGIGIVAVLLGHAVLTVLRRRARPRAILTLAIAVAAPTLVAAAVLAAQGALGDAAYAIGAFNRLYFASGDASLVQMWPSVIHAAALFAPVSIMWALAGLGVLLGSARLARVRAPHSDVALIVLWLVASGYLCCLGVGRMSYHVAPLLAPLALLTIHAIMIPLGDGPLIARFQSRAWTAGLAVVFLACVAQAGSSSLIDAQQCWREKSAWYSLTRRAALDYERQGAEIAQMTQPAERIYVWGWSPGAYRFSQRRAASRFGTLEKVGQLRERALFILDGAKADIVARRPAIFAISAGDWAGLRGEDNEFSRWMRQHYAQAAEVDGMILLRPVDPARDGQ